MKFTLILFLCSFINNECLPPQEIKQHYNSWKECTLAALEISTEIMLLQEEEFVNKNKVATKFICQRNRYYLNENIRTNYNRNAY
jgi:hypothetical protein